MRAPLHIELSDADQQMLRQAAQDRGVSVEHAAAHLLREALHKAWLGQEIACGVADADAGRWADEAEISAIFARNGVQWP